MLIDATTQAHVDGALSLGSHTNVILQANLDEVNDVSAISAFFAVHASIIANPPFWVNQKVVLKKCYFFTTKNVNYSLHYDCASKAMNLLGSLNRANSVASLPP